MPLWPSAPQPQTWKGGSSGRARKSASPSSGPPPGMPYLSSKVLHVGAKLTEEVIALVEEGQVGVHEGQHLERKREKAISSIPCVKALSASAAWQTRVPAGAPLWPAGWLPPLPPSGRGSGWGRLWRAELPLRTHPRPSVSGNVPPLGPGTSLLPSLLISSASWNNPWIRHSVCLQGLRCPHRLSTHSPPPAPGIPKERPMERSHPGSPWPHAVEGKPKAPTSARWQGKGPATRPPLPSASCSINCVSREAFPSFPSLNN